MRQVLMEELIEKFQQPRTCHELGDVMGVNYHTARRYLKGLLDADLIMELPRRTDKGAIVYVLKKESADALEFYFPLGKDMVTIAEAVDRVTRFFRAMKNPGSTLAFLVQRSYWLERNNGLDRMDPQRRWEGGAGADPVKLRADLRTLAQSLEKVSKLLLTITSRDDLWAADNRRLGSLFERSGWNATQIETIHAYAEEAFKATFPQNNLAPVESEPMPPATTSILSVVQQAPETE